MSPQDPCIKGLNKGCFKAHPAFARQALAYRLLHLLIAPEFSKFLPKTLRLPLRGKDAIIPLDVELPPGTVLVPGCEFPPGWDPEEELPECVLSKPLPRVPITEFGPVGPLYTGAWEPGPPNNVHAALVAACSQYFDNTCWTATTGSWDSVNNKWLIEHIGNSSYAIELHELGTWVEGYRPETFIVTFEGTGTANIYLKDTDNYNLNDPALNISSDDELTLNWYGYDIDRIVFSASAGNNITNIQFCP